VTQEQKADYLNSIQKRVAALRKQIDSKNGKNGHRRLVVLPQEPAKTARPTSRRWLWVTIVLQAVAAVALVSYAVFASNLLQQLRKELGMLQKEVQTSVDSSRLQDRAWLELQPMQPQLMYPEDTYVAAGYRYDIRLKNTGKTVADNLVVRALVTTGRLGLSEDSQGIQSWQDRLLPGKPATADKDSVVIFTSDRLPKMLAPGATSPVALGIIANEPRNVTYRYIFGRADYTDVFGVSHWLTFSFLVADDVGHLVYCKGGNDRDRNRENAAGR